MNFKDLFTLVVFLELRMIYCATFYGIGIYSNCTGKVNRTQLNIDAGFVSDFNRDMIQGTKSYANSLGSHEFTESIYKEYDVCDNFTLLAEIVDNLILNDNFHFRSHDTNLSYSLIDAFFMQTPPEMTSFVKNVFTEIPVYNVDHRIQEDGSIYNPVDDFVEDLTRLVEFASWGELTLVTLTLVEFPYLEYFRKTVEVLQRLKVCIEFYHIDTQTGNNSTEFIKELPDANQRKTVILFGHESDQYVFLRNILREFGRIPFFPVIRLKYWRLDPAFDFVRIINGLENIDLSANQISNLINTGRILVKTFYALRDYLKMEAARNAKRFFWQIIRIFKIWKLPWRLERRKYRTVTDIIYHSNAITEYELVQNGTKLIRLMKWEHSTYFNDKLGKIIPGWESGWENFREFLTKSRNDPKCEKPICEPGYHLIYGNASKNSFSWKCVLCPENTFKPFSGNRSCQKCPGRFNIDNGKRTVCIDPYENVQIGLSNQEFVLLVVLCALGASLTFFSLIVFVVKRKTPIVSVSDYTVSLIHMVIIGLLFVTVPFTFIGKPNFHICTWRLISISVFYVTNIGIVFMKSQKLLLAYLSKVRLSAEEIKRSKIVQVFVVVMLVVSVNTLFVIAIHQRPITNNETLDTKNMMSYLHCNNAFHGNVLIASTMIIQLMCSIQAFRGRNLPSVMNDGIVLMYATFTLTIVFGVSFVIVNAQPPQTKELFQCIAVTINNVVIVFLMYTQKALRMLIFPERNTRAYFQRERMRERSQDVNQAMEMRLM